jgi:hypothetical protein
MRTPFSGTDYRLQSSVTGNLFEDSGWLLDAPGESAPGLIRAIYKQKQLYPGDE